MNSPAAPEKTPPQGRPENPGSSGRGGRDNKAGHRIAIVQTGQPPLAVQAQHGDFPEWFARHLGVSAERLRIYRAFAGEPLPAPGSPEFDAMAGVIVTGSPAMITEHPNSGCDRSCGKICPFLACVMATSYWRRPPVDKWPGIPAAAKSARSASATPRPLVTIPCFRLCWKTAASP